MEDTAPDRDIISVIRSEFAAKEKADALRHKAVLAISDEQVALRSDHVALKGRVAKLESNSVEGLRWPAWALVAIVTVGELAIVGLEAAHMWSVL